MSKAPSQSPEARCDRQRAGRVGGSDRIESCRKQGPPTPLSPPAPQKSPSQWLLQMRHCKAPPVTTIPCYPVSNAFHPSQRGTRRVTVFWAIALIFFYLRQKARRAESCLESSGLSSAFLEAPSSLLTPPHDGESTGCARRAPDLHLHLRRTRRQM